jgi:hypothetical protein
MAASIKASGKATTAIAGSGKELPRAKPSGAKIVGSGRVVESRSTTHFGANRLTIHAPDKSCAPTTGKFPVAARH